MIFGKEEKTTHDNLMRLYRCTLEGQFDEEVRDLVEGTIYYDLAMPYKKCVVFNDVVIAPSFRYKKPRILHPIIRQQFGKKMSLACSIASNFIEAQEAWQEVQRVLGDDRDSKQYAILKEHAESVGLLIKQSRYPNDGCIVLLDCVIEWNSIIEFPRVLVPFYNYPTRFFRDRNEAASI